MKNNQGNKTKNSKNKTTSSYNYGKTNTNDCGRTTHENEKNCK